IRQLISAPIPPALAAAAAPSEEWVTSTAWLGPFPSRLHDAVRAAASPAPGTGGAGRAAR
ncbi:MAG: hypothetical protein LBD90_10090, partial [Bifidobacteriaceae bacterium]|nr:hypothetical protein [Bifidobacteriaceae bacterium]